MSEKLLDRPEPTRRVRRWQFLVVIAMLGLAMVLLGIARHLFRGHSPVSPPTTAPTYGTRW